MNGADDPNPPSLRPDAYGLDDPTGDEAKMLADDARNGVEALAQAGSEEARLLIESLDRDQSAIDAIRACL